jgi:electron transfer flavoprotein alpha subunit
MIADVLVIAEHDGREISPITFDLLYWGAQVARKNNWRLGVLLAGFEIGKFLNELQEASSDVVFVLDDPGLQQYTVPRYLHAIAGAIKQTTPQLVLMGHSYFGIEMGGGLAVILKSPLVSNCLSIDKVEGGFGVTRPIYGGTLLTRLHIQSAPPVLISMQKGSLPNATNAARNKRADIIRLDVPKEDGPSKLKVLKEKRPAIGEDITKAKTLIAVGRGIGQETKLGLFRELAEELGATIAASRPIVDMGWLPADHQVGLSGQTVKPNVYLACGISGAAQHLAGMRDAPLIIAINKDPAAPIFQVAHYGVVGDLFDFVPPLLRIAKEFK